MSAMDFVSHLLSNVSAVHLLTAVVSVWLVHSIIQYKLKFSYWSKKGVKGPTPAPVFGNVLPGFFRPSQEVFFDRCQKYGKVFGVYFLQKPVLVVNDPEMIRLITVKDSHVFVNRRSFGEIGDEIIKKFLSIMRDEDWKRVRTILTPTFTSGKMKKMFELMDNCTQDCVEYVEKNHANIDLKDLFGKYSLEVIAKCCFAMRPDCYNNPENKFLVYANRLLKPPFLWMIFGMVMPSSITQMVRAYRSKTGPIDYFKHAINHLIKERKETGIRGNDFLQLLIDAQKENRPDAEGDDGNEVVDTEAHHANEDKEDSKVSQRLFDRTKLKKKTLDDNEVVANAALFLAAGSETTATLLTFVFYHLAIDLVVQETLHNELVAAKEVDYSTVSSLPYLDAVIQETLRMYPPAHMVDREASEDYSLPGTSFTIEKGTGVILPIYSIHHNPEHYPEPEEFDPRRFLPLNRDKIKPYTYLPFGAGPRNCIGMRFALLEAKLLIARMVLKFFVKRTQLTLVPPRFVPSTGLLAFEPVRVSFEVRE